MNRYSITRRKVFHNNLFKKKICYHNILFNKEEVMWITRFYRRYTAVKLSDITTSFKTSGTAYYFWNKCKYNDIKEFTVFENNKISFDEADSK